MPLRLKKLLSFTPGADSDSSSSSQAPPSPSGSQKDASAISNPSPPPPSTGDAFLKAPRPSRPMSARSEVEVADRPDSPPLDEEETDPTSAEHFLGQLWRAVRTGDVMTKGAYCRLHAALFRALRTTFNADEAAATADKDWSADAGGKEYLDRASFCNSMSSLAQKCVHPATDAKSIAEFLNALADAVTALETQPGSRRPRRVLRDWPDVPLGSVLGAVVRIRSAALAPPPPPPPPPRAVSPSRGRPENRGRADSFAAPEAPEDDPVMLSQRRARRSWQGGSSGSIALRRFAAANAALRKASGRSLSPSVGRERPQTFARDGFSAEY